MIYLTHVLSLENEIDDSPAVLQGSYRTQGGIIRGRAAGGIANAADLEETVSILDIKGKAYLYITNLNPSIVQLAEINPSCFVTTKVSASTAVILMKLKRRFEHLADGQYTLYFLDKDSDWEL